ncbi:MAG: glutathione binding-like protein [Pacificimonas sp.]
MTMTLYYSPGACSLADHIALAESGLDYDTVSVDLKTHKTEDGRDYYDITPKGAVGAIETGGEVFTENAALLVMIAEKSGKLLPKDGTMRYRVLEATVFITTEVHKSFAPLFQGGSDAEKQAAREKIGKKFDHMETMLGDKAFLVGKEMSIADCYAVVMLFWATSQKIDLPPKLAAYMTNIVARPAVQTAMKAEGLMN